MKKTGHMWEQCQEKQSQRFD